VLYAGDKLGAKHALERFAGKWRAMYPDAVKCLERDFEAVTAYLDFPELEWMHLRTTNIIERLHKEFKRRTKPMEIVAGEESVYRVLAFVAMTDGSVLEERTVSEFRFPETQAFRRLFHTRKLTRPRDLHRLTEQRGMVPRAKEAEPCIA